MNLGIHRASESRQPPANRRIPPVARTESAKPADIDSPGAKSMIRLTHAHSARTPWLRRPGNKDCLRILEKLEAWFLRQYDIHHAAAMIQHADNVAKGVDDSDRILSWHRTRTYVACLALLAAPFAAAAVAYGRAPRLFDVWCAAELLVADLRERLQRRDAGARGPVDL